MPAKRIYGWTGDPVLDLVTNSFQRRQCKSWPSMTNRHQNTFFCYFEWLIWYCYRKFDYCVGLSSLLGHCIHYREKRMILSPLAFGRWWGDTLQLLLPFSFIRVIDRDPHFCIVSRSSTCTGPPDLTSLLRDILRVQLANTRLSIVTHFLLHKCGNLATNLTMVPASHVYPYQLKVRHLNHNRKYEYNDTLVTQWISDHVQFVNAPHVEHSSQTSLVFTKKSLGLVIVIKIVQHLSFRKTGHENHTPEMLLVNSRWIHTLFIFGHLHLLNIT